MKISSLSCGPVQMTNTRAQVFYVLGADLFFFWGGGGITTVLLY